MPHYLTIHHDPELPRERIEARWIELAQERRALWVKTWFNLSKGKRFCWWDAPNQTALERVFSDHQVTWDEIVKVDITNPSDWRWRDD
ncbi:MAG: nickel-binding protein [Thermodesulfobacteriota bacterium]